MNQVLEWIKSNVFIVIFALLMVGGLVALPILSAGMNEKVKDTVNDRSKLIADMKALNKTTVNLPQVKATGDGSPQVLVNDALLEQYRQAAEQLRGDADAVVEAALAFNKKSHVLFMERIFPEMPAREAEVLPKDFHGVIDAAYDSLLNGINAGSPPSRFELADELRRAEVNFIAQSVQKENRDELTADELEELKKTLTAVRLAKNREQAEKIGLYVSKNILPAPQWYQQEIPTIAYMFNWNWEYWVVSDLLHALYRANEADQTVLLAPVKRVTRLTVFDLPAVTRSAASAGGRSGGGGTMSGAGGRPGSAGGHGGGGGSGDEGGAGQPINPSAQIPKNYEFRFTGRISNPLYDVLQVQLDLIVDSTRIPEVLDKIAQENFFTVVDLKIDPVDAFAEAAQGYMYGSAPVCKLMLTIDTVWLRQWTTEKMPMETRKLLGAPMPPAPGASTDG